MVDILIKKKSKSITLPKYESRGASGVDISAHIQKSITIKPNSKAIIPTGLFLSIPDGYEIQIRPRSGLAAKKSISILNTPGTIDSDYRGEIKVILINLGNKEFVIEKGNRIAQMVLCPIAKIEFKEVEDFKETKRGAKGFGSTGIE